MHYLTTFCLFLYAAVTVHSFPRIEKRDLPDVGKQCAYTDLTQNGQSTDYNGYVKKTDSCRGGMSFWFYGDYASVQCCIRSPCTQSLGEDLSSHYCMNIYKTEDCGDQGGKFVPDHCPGGSDIQCCVKEDSVVPETSPNSGGNGGAGEGTTPKVNPEGGPTPEATPDENNLFEQPKTPPASPQPVPQQKKPIQPANPAPQQKKPIQPANPPVKPTSEKTPHREEYNDNQPQNLFHNGRTELPNGLSTHPAQTGDVSYNYLQNGIEQPSDGSDQAASSVNIWQQDGIDVVS